MLGYLYADRGDVSPAAQPKRGAGELFGAVNYAGPSVTAATQRAAGPGPCYT